MAEALAYSWPFLLLIGVFVGFAVVMQRTLGKGGGDVSYMSLMQDQVRTMQAQAAQQAELIDLVRRQTEALEKIAERSDRT